MSIDFSVPPSPLLSRRRFTAGIVASLFLAGCTRRPHATLDPRISYYTCAMHPSVHSDDPQGRCPICGMDLVPVFKEIIASHAPTHPFTLSPDQEQLLGLVSVPLTQREAIRTLRAPGRVEAGNGIIASFFEEDAFLLAPGQASEITFETLPGVTLPGKISSLVAVANPISHRMETRIDLDQTDRRLRLGFIVTVQVFIPLGRRLIAPLGAVLPTGERHVVLVDLGEGKIEPRYVKTGMALADGWEIISGAKEGERLLTSANFLVDAQARIAGALQGWGETP